MKNILSILMCVLLGSTAFSQKYYYTPDPVSVQGDTSYIPSAAGYDTKNIESGVISFTFTKADVADSLSIARLEGSDNGVVWIAQAGTGALLATTTDGTSKMYLSTPLIYRHYRVILACASGDTVTVTNQVLMLKED